MCAREKKTEIISTFLMGRVIGMHPLLEWGIGLNTWTMSFISWMSVFVNVRWETSTFPKLIFGGGTVGFLFLHRAWDFMVLERTIFLLVWFFKTFFSLSSQTSGDICGTPIFQNYMATYSATREKWDSF